MSRAPSRDLSPIFFEPESTLTPAIMVAPAQDQHQRTPVPGAGEGSEDEETATTPAAAAEGEEKQDGQPTRLIDVQKLTELHRAARASLEIYDDAKANKCSKTTLAHLYSVATKDHAQYKKYKAEGEPRAATAQSSRLVKTDDTSPVSTAEKPQSSTGQVPRQEDERVGVAAARGDAGARSRGERAKAVASDGGASTRLRDEEVTDSWYDSDAEVRRQAQEQAENLVGGVSETRVRSSRTEPSLAPATSVKAAIRAPAGSSGPMMDATARGVSKLGALDGDDVTMGAEPAHPPPATISMLDLQTLLQGLTSNLLSNNNLTSKETRRAASSHVSFADIDRATRHDDEERGKGTRPTPADRKAPRPKPYTAESESDLDDVTEETDGGSCGRVRLPFPKLTDAKNLRPWEFEMINAFDVNGVTSSIHQLKIAASCGDDGTREALRAALVEQPQPKTFSALCARLKDNFGFYHDEYFARDELDSHQQTGALNVYNDQFRILQARSGITDEKYLAHRYTKGLKPLLRAKVQEQMPKTLKEAARAAKAHEHLVLDVDGGETSIFKSKAAKVGVNALEARELVEMVVAQMSAAAWSENKKAPQKYRRPAFTPEQKKDFDNDACFLCHQPGHRKANCPTKPKKP